MANPETPRQNPRIPFAQKGVSQTSFPTSPTPTPTPRPTKTHSNSTLHNPPPPPSPSSSTQSSPSSRSYYSAPSSPTPTAPRTPPSNLTSKMRNLWNTSHSKSFLSNLNIGLATNFPPLKNLNLHSKKISSVVRADEGVELGVEFRRDEYHDYMNRADHTDSIPAAIPIPKLSSPNGKPAKSLVYCGGNVKGAAGDGDRNPLSGPSTQHAEYLILRVEGKFMGPDTPPLETPSGRLLSGFGSGSGGYGDGWMKGTCKNENENENENAGTGDMRDAEEGKQRGMNSRSGDETGREKMIPKRQNQKTWKSIHQSCREMLDNIHLSKCDGEVPKITGQENGNRFVGAGNYTDIVNDEDEDDNEGDEDADETANNHAESYDEFDVFTDAHAGPGSGKYWEKNQSRHRLIHTESRDSMVEIYTTSPVSASVSSFSSSWSRFALGRLQGRVKTPMQMQDQLDRQQSREKSLIDIIPLFPTNTYLENRSTIVANFDAENHHQSSDVTTKPEIQNQIQANPKTDIEDPLNKSIPIPTPLKPFLESDFAYMHMRPKPRSNPAAPPETALRSMSEKGNVTVNENENENTYRYHYRHPNNNDEDNEDARSTLDMEDSLYDNEDENPDRNPQYKYKLHIPRAEASYPDFTTMMERDRMADAYAYLSPRTPKPHSASETWSQKCEFDADAALEASLSSLARMQFEYQVQCLAGSQSEIVS
ncbi:hypothetical protein EAE96_006660 [Botrytis aclada]|nr:hypothetical protein EAE96_006660 [Botrytis aclada]